MLKKPITILGINPGTRYLGVALFQGTELRDWGVKVVASREKIRRAMLVVSNIIEQQQPDVLAIKRLHPARSSPELKQLASRIRTLAKRKRIRLYQYSINDLEEFFSPGEKINKRALAELVVSECSALFPQLEKEKKHRNSYYLRMFEAVALAAMYSRKVDKH